MKSWKSRISFADDHNLTENGRRYMKELGYRMHNRVYNLVSNIKTNQITVRCSNEARTQQSADEYLAGMLGFKPKYKLPIYQINPADSDYLLKSSDMCKKYVDVRNLRKKLI